MLIHLYSSYNEPLAMPLKGGKPLNGRGYSDDPASNGKSRAPAPNAATDRQMRDVQEFELEGLMSDDEDETSKKSNGRA